MDGLPDTAILEPVNGAVALLHRARLLSAENRKSDGTGEVSALLGFFSRDLKRLKGWRHMAGSRSMLADQ